MRIAKKFGERTAHFEKLQNEKRKYILAYEGQETEVQYFQGIIDNRELIGVDPIIDLLPLLRSNLQQSHSHPFRVLKLIEEHIENYDSVKVLIDKTIDFCVENLAVGENSSYSMRALEKDLTHHVQETCHLKLEDKATNKNEVITELIKCIEKQLDLSNQIDNIIGYIEEQQVLFSKDLDYLCLIIDRDKGNVKEYQYLEIIKKCEEKNIRLFVTNPAFEFWLLLHSDKFSEYSATDLLLNSKKGRKRFLERTLSEVYDGYQKKDIKFERFIPHIKTAIANEKVFCQDIIELQSKLGSNVGTLISEFISRK